MQVFEFHFNPKTKEGTILDSFVYEPENIYEKNLGNLFIAGQLVNALPQNYQFLNNLASVIKRTYYLISAKSSPEKSFKNGLEEANSFLEQEEKKGNIGWLGNLNLAIMNLKDFNINFTKTGDIKILLARGSDVVDIGKELDSKEAETLSLKTFSNIVTGKLSPEDKIIILSKEIFSVFEKENVFGEIFSIFESNEKPKKTDLELKKILNRKKNILTEISGLFLLIFLDRLHEETIEIKKPVTLEKKLSLLSPIFLIKNNIKKRLGKIFKVKNLISKLPAAKKFLTFLERSLKESSKKINYPTPKEPAVSSETNSFGPKSRAKIKIPVLQKNFPFSISDFKKLLIIIILLFIILVIGNHVFKSQQQDKNETFQIYFDEIQRLITEAENAVIYNDLAKSNLLYQEALDKILSLNQKDKNFSKDEISRLQEQIEKELFSLNNLEEIKEPKIIFNFSAEEFLPKNLALSGSNLYFWNLNFSKVFILDSIKIEKKAVEINKNIELGTKLGDYILFSTKSDLIILKNNAQCSIKNLDFPVSNFNPTALSALGLNFYLLDYQKGEIVKFRFEEEKEKFSGEIWLNKETKRASNAGSMTIDGAIWVSADNNIILKYYKGDLQEEIKLNLFPEIEHISKIFTAPNFDYLYLLTPKENRIIILNKKGEVFKQYQSDKFENLTDFAISENEKNIYLLSDSSLYRIDI